MANLPPSGYSGKPLWQKLGLREGMGVYLVNTTNEPIPEYWLDAPFPVNLIKDTDDGIKLLHLFVDNRANLLRESTRLLPLLASGGIWWVSWPKKASGRGSNLTEDVMREVLLPLGVVDVKVCSVTDELWSGLKFLWRRQGE